MNFIEEFARRGLLKLDAEKAHGLGIQALKLGLVPPKPIRDNPRLRVEVAGLTFPNPLGIAAGFDKNAEVPDALLRRGMGFAEVGTVTPRPQPGNPKPRVFRMEADQAVINRLGFNNEGHASVYERLKARRQRGGIVGVNIGANKDSFNFITDYVEGIHRFYDVADYFTANISSPNTPGLRGLQASDALNRLLAKVRTAGEEKAQQLGRKVPIFLKIAPDIDDKEIREIAQCVLHHGLQAVIVSNTTVERSTVEGRPNAAEAGGLSGKPLFEPSTLVLAKMRKAVGPDFPLIGVGGITDGASALAKIRAGANLLQVYTGLIYTGFRLIDEVHQELDLAVKNAKVANISELSGLDTDTLIAT